MKLLLNSNYVQAGTKITYDAAGLKTAIFKLFEVALSKSEFSSCGLDITSIRITKCTRPVSYLARIEYKLTGDILSRYKHSSGTLFLSDIPVNQTISEDYYVADDSVMNEVIASMQKYYLLQDNLSGLVAEWETYKTKLQTKAQELSTKYGITLTSRVYPNEPENSSTEQYIDFILGIVDFPVPDGVDVVNRADIGSNCFTLKYNDLEKFVSLPLSKNGYHPNLDLDSIFNVLETKLKDRLSTINRTVNTLVAKHDQYHKVIEWADSFIEKYQSQYPELSYNIDEYDDFTFYVSEDPDISVSGEISWERVGNDSTYFTKLTRSVLGKIKRRLNKEAENYGYNSNSAELITL